MSQGRNRTTDTRIFSRKSAIRWIINKLLAALACPKAVYPWHIPGTPNLNAVHSWQTAFQTEVPGNLGRVPVMA